MIHPMKKAALLMIVGCLSLSANAVDIRWSGFGTIGAGQTLDDDQFFEANALENEDGLLEDELTFEPLSVFAVQSNINLTNGLSATLQLKSVGAEDYDIEAEWAYLSYDINSKLTLQAGRKLNPVYLFTDSIDLGYTYHWIRPPADVYLLEAISYNGANLLYQDYAGDWEFSSNIWFGSERGSEDFGDNLSGEQIDADYDIWGASFEATYDWASFRLATTTYRDLTLSNLSAAVTQDVEFDSDYYSLSVSLRPGNWFIVGEYTFYNSEGDDLEAANIVASVPSSIEGRFPFLDDLESAWYISAAYTIGKWTPHITYSERTFENQGIDSNSPIFSLPGTSALQSAAEERSTLSVGVRYDFYKSASIKFEYHRRDDDTSFGGESRPRNGNTRDQVDAIQIAVDFIF